MENSEIYYNTSKFDDYKQKYIYNYSMFNIWNL